LGIVKKSPVSRQTLHSFGNCVQFKCILERFSTITISPAGFYFLMRVWTLFLLNRKSARGGLMLSFCDAGAYKRV